MVPQSVWAQVWVGTLKNQYTVECLGEGGVKRTDFVVLSLRVTDLGAHRRVYTRGRGHFVCEERREEEGRRCTSRVVSALRLPSGLVTLAGG